MPQQIDVVGAVFVENGRVFAARRGPDRAMPGMWEFPGGKVEPSESPEEALARELKEELLIDARVGARLTTTQHGVVKLSTYYCELIAGTPVLTEHAEARWVPFDNLGDLDWAPADVPAMKLVAEELRNGSV